MVSCWSMHHTWCLMCAMIMGVVVMGQDDTVSGADNFAVAAYLPEWRYEGANWNTISTHVSHLILFSLEMDGRTGQITALDRLPRKELLAEARRAATEHGTHLMICFGGNGRSGGFSRMVRHGNTRARFIKNLMELMDKHDLDGVDYNWEYPGYTFGGGYMSDEEVKKDYRGLGKLLADTRAAVDAHATRRDRVITMAYYPDGRQEQLIKKHGYHKHVDLMHMMTYDQNGGQHSSNEFASKAIKQGAEILPPRSLTLGLPFYGRHSRTGDWTTWEDIVQKHHPLDSKLDSVYADDRPHTIGFNGPATIARKTSLAVAHDVGGVMIWEVGQDCRLEAVTHGDTTHVVTCPAGDRSSLLVAITNTITEQGRQRARAAAPYNRTNDPASHTEL